MGIMTKSAYIFPGAIAVDAVTKRKWATLIFLSQKPLLILKDFEKCIPF